MSNDVPVALCKKCQLWQEVTVFDFEGEQVVICPHCESILSADKDVKVLWYDEEDL